MKDPDNLMPLTLALTLTNPAGIQPAIPAMCAGRQKTADHIRISEKSAAQALYHSLPY
jgi:hypothetical protein